MTVLGGLAQLLTPGRRVFLVEQVYLSVFRRTLLVVGLLGPVAIGLAVLNPHGAWPGTAALAIPASGAALWTATPTRTKRAYRYLRRYRWIPALAGLVGPACLVVPATDPNGLYFPAVAAVGISVAVAQRRREIALTVAAIATGTLIAAIWTPVFPASHRLAGAVESTLGVIVVGELLTLLVDLVARWRALEPSGRDKAAARSNPQFVSVAAAVRAPSQLAVTGHQRFRPRAELQAIVESLGRLATARNDGFTCREAELYTLLSLGFSQREAADFLGISPRTVYSMTGRTRTRLGLQTNNDVIERFRTLGYLDLIGSPDAEDAPSIGLPRAS